MISKSNQKLLLIAIIVVIVAGCNKSFEPKPNGILLNSDNYIVVSSSKTVPFGYEAREEQFILNFELKIDTSLIYKHETQADRIMLSNEIIQENGCLAFSCYCKTKLLKDTLSYDIDFGTFILDTNGLVNGFKTVLRYTNPHEMIKSSKAFEIYAKRGAN